MAEEVEPDDAMKAGRTAPKQRIVILRGGLFWETYIYVYLHIIYIYIYALSAHLPTWKISSSLKAFPASMGSLYFCLSAAVASYDHSTQGNRVCFPSCITK